MSNCFESNPSNIICSRPQQDCIMKRVTNSHEKTGSTQFKTNSRTEHSYINTVQPESKIKKLRTNNNQKDGQRTFYSQDYIADANNSKSLSKNKLGSDKKLHGNKSTTRTTTTTATNSKFCCFPIKDKKNSKKSNCLTERIKIYQEKRLGKNKQKHQIEKADQTLDFSINENRSGQKFSPEHTDKVYCPEIKEKANLRKQSTKCTTSRAEIKGERFGRIVNQWSEPTELGSLSCYDTRPLSCYDNYQINELDSEFYGSLDSKASKMSKDEISDLFQASKKIKIYPEPL